MIKQIASLGLLLVVLFSSNAANAATKKKKKKKSHAKTHKVVHHSRKTKHYKHGNGPDLKAITTDSPYKEDPNNGVTPVETKQPGQ